MQTAQFAPLSRCKICGNCKNANFNLNPEDERRLKNTAEHDGLRTMRTWIRPRKALFTLGSTGDVERKKALKIILANQAHCRKTKVRIAWPDMACFLWQSTFEHPGVL